MLARQPDRRRRNRVKRHIRGIPPLGNKDHRRTEPERLTLRRGEKLVAPSIEYFVRQPDVSDRP